MDISLQEGAHVISHKKIKEVALLKVNIKGNGSFKGYPIRAHDEEITIEGRGSYKVTALSRMNVDIVDNANVYCMGIPTIHKRFTGKDNVHFTN